MFSDFTTMGTQLEVPQWILREKKPMWMSQGSDFGVKCSPHSCSRGNQLCRARLALDVDGFCSSVFSALGGFCVHDCTHWLMQQQRFGDSAGITKGHLIDAAMMCGFVLFEVLGVCRRFSSKISSVMISCGLFFANYAHRERQSLSDGILGVCFSPVF